MECFLKPERIACKLVRKRCKLYLTTSQENYPAVHVCTKNIYVKIRNQDYFEEAPWRRLQNEVTRQYESISLQKPSILKPNNKAINGTDSFDLTIDRL